MYKKVALLLILIGCFYNGNAQIQKGSLVFGANAMVTFTGSSRGSNNLTSMIFPELSYMVNANTALGFNIGYIRQVYYYQRRLIYGYNNTSAAFLIKKYFPIHEGRYGFFLSHQLCYASQISDDKIVKFQHWDYILTPGFYLFLTNRFALEAHLTNIHLIKNTVDSAPLVWQFNSSMDSFLIGFKWYLSKSKK